MAAAGGGRGAKEEQEGVMREGGAVEGVNVQLAQQQGEPLQHCQGPCVTLWGGFKGWNGQLHR